MRRFAAVRPDFAQVSADLPGSSRLTIEEERIPNKHVARRPDNDRRSMQTGRPADQAVEWLAASCPIPEAQAAMLLMQRYDRYGGSETLQMLSMQAAACWSLYRNTIRKQMEHQSLRLLLPMMLDLLAVILTALLPAVLSLRTF